MLEFIFSSTCCSGDSLTIELQEEVKALPVFIPRLTLCTHANAILLYMYWVLSNCLVVWKPYTNCSSA